MDVNCTLIIFIIMKKLLWLITLTNICTYMGHSLRNLSNTAPISVPAHERLISSILLTWSKHGEAIDIKMSGSHRVHIYVTDLYLLQDLFLGI